MSLLQGLFQQDTTKREINIDSKIRAIAFLPEERHRIVSCEEGTGFQLRDLEDQLVGQPIDSSTGALAVAVSKDGRWIVTGAANGFAIRNRNWEIVTRHDDFAGVRTIDISADSKWAVTGSDARTVDVWELSTGQRRTDAGQFKHEYNVVAVKLCPCSARLATATLFGSIRIFAFSSGQKLFTIPVSLTATLATPNMGLTWFSSPSRLFVAAQGQIKCLNSDDGSIIYQWPMRKVSSPSTIALSPNNKLIAYSANEVVVIRNIATRDQIGESLKHEGNVWCIAFSPGSERLVVGADTKFTVWDLEKLVPDAALRGTAVQPIRSCEHQDRKKPPPPTFLLPLMSITNEAVKPWLHSFLPEAEEVFSKEIARSTKDYNVYANRALMRGRLERGDEALKDAEESLRMKKSAIGQIAKVMALIKKGEHKLAKREIPKVLDICPPGQHELLLRVIQSILFCISGDYEQEYPNVIKLNGDKKLLLLVQANMHLSKQKFDTAMKSFRSAHVPVMFPYDESPEMRSISYIFGWKFNGLGVQIQQKKCDSLLAADESDAAHLFLQVMDTYHREIVTHVELSDWAIEFRRSCTERLETLGDEAHASKKYGEAADYYTAVISLVGEPEIKHALLLKRSDAHVNIGPKNWQQALLDADEAVRLNSYSPWGYERRHLVLYKMNHYHEAAEALEKVFSSIPYSEDPRSKALRDQGVKPGERRKIILDVAEETFNGPRPHMLINTESGRICDKPKQLEAYKAFPDYKNLVLDPDSPVGKVGTDWQESVRKYFRYCTLSHTWEEKGELDFREVEPRTLDKLTESFSDTKPASTKKLQIFCKKTREHGYFWAWSDTCCINKAEKEVLDISLRSMYRWYFESSLTIVHLKGVLRHLDVEKILCLLDELLKGIEESQLNELLDDFVTCRWNQRAWTLQEYFASNSIHFYTEDWEPYLPIDSYDPDTNPIDHKQHRAIQRGMQLVTQLDPERLAALKPGTDDARQKLRLASARKASRKEDVAYSLLGIFQVTIEAVYGDDEVPRALGRLLGALLSQSADVSILAWTGKSSEYNTCLPSDIVVYKGLESDYIPEIEHETADLTMLASLSSKDLEVAAKLHDRLLDCPPPEILHGRLKLSCISFPVELSPDSNRNRYTAMVPMLGISIELKSLESVPSSSHTVLIHPWFRHLLSPGISMSESARRENGEKLIAALRQPFGALLLAFNRAAQDYRRIVADQLITVQIPESVSPSQLLECIHVLHIR